MSQVFRVLFRTPTTTRIITVTAIVTFALGLGLGAVLWAGGDTCESCAVEPITITAGDRLSITDEARGLEPIGASDGFTITDDASIAFGDVSGADTFTVTDVADIELGPPASPEPCPGEPILDIRDETFDDADWTSAVIANTEDQWMLDEGFVGQNRDGATNVTAGNPAPSRWVWYTFGGGVVPAFMQVGNEYLKEASDGKAGSVAFEFDANGNSVLVEPLIIQGETYYVAEGVEVNRQTGWVSYPSVCLVAADFRKAAGPGPSTPDFSEPIRFGYSTASTTRRTDHDRRISVVDNWRVTVWS